MTNFIFFSYNRLGHSGEQIKILEKEMRLCRIHIDVRHWFLNISHEYLFTLILFVLLKLKCGHFVDYVLPTLTFKRLFCLCVPVCNESVIYLDVLSFRFGSCIDLENF